MSIEISQVPKWVWSSSSIRSVRSVRMCFDLLRHFRVEMNSSCFDKCRLEGMLSSTWSYRTVL